MPIQHVFVLMLENRSFDHLLGYLPRVDGVKPGMSNPNLPGHHPDPVPATATAIDRPKTDPAHEFENVWMQLYSSTPNSSGDSRPTPTMDGFVRSGGEEPMTGFPDGAAPILQQLAKEFVVFDRWFSSMPGPTWPNRFFVHAASSGGLTNSPSAFTSLMAVTLSSAAFDFQHGTIYDQLDAAKLPWRIFHGDHFPQALALKRHVVPFVQSSGNFEWIRPGDKNDPFSQQVNDKNFDAAYSFIEPDYSILTSMSAGNSQHPRGRVSSGEALIKYVYETIRNSPHWQTSVLLVTYDEHGGFFDHAAPDPCVPPGDQPINFKRAKHPYPFDFQRYGIRVPAVLVSPWVDPGVCHDAFDHASVIRSLRDFFPKALNAQPPLTHRDDKARSFAHLLARNEPRDNSPARLGNAVRQSQTPAPVAPVDLNAPPDPTLAGFTRIAASVDVCLRHLEKEPQATMVPEEVRLPEIPVSTAADSLDYIQQVVGRLSDYRMRAR